jgi:hypothetical protein
MRWLVSYPAMIAVYNPLWDIQYDGYYTVAHLSITLPGSSLVLRIVMFRGGTVNKDVYSNP